MKAYSDNGESYGYYAYDASGERIYKLQLNTVSSNTNTYPNIKNLEVEKFTLYPNGYININQDGEYSKHYYAGDQRIASKIGREHNGICAITHQSHSSQLIKDELSRVIPNETVSNISYSFDTLCSLQGINSSSYENEIFFYHSDHLGNAQFVTDGNGGLVQKVLYAPFGEIIGEYNAYSWRQDKVPDFLFNGKELDEENGMYYYSARYYNPPTFISRYPLFEKYPYISPYVYCANNPFIFIDPSGKIPWPIIKNYNGAIRKFTNGMYRNSSGPYYSSNSYHGKGDIAHVKGGKTIAGGVVMATHDGTVTRSGTSKSAGNWIQITNGDVRTTYRHLQDPPTLKNGDLVKEAMPIGTVGNTGNSTAHHLDYQIEIKNTETNKWEDLNPVVGGQLKVNASMNVELIDPQQLLTPIKDGGSLTPVEVKVSNLCPEIPKSRSITEFEITK